MSSLPAGAALQPESPPADRRAILAALERKVLWLASWTIHNANHLRPSRDGLKVGGHQASCSSLTAIMTALYFDVLRPEDRVAVKPHAAPVFHAIQYLFGRESRERLERFRSLGGRSPTRRAPRTTTTSTSRPARSGSARPRPCSRRWSRTISPARGRSTRTGPGG